MIFLFFLSGYIRQELRKLLLFCGIFSGLLWKPSIFAIRSQSNNKVNHLQKGGIKGYLIYQRICTEEMRKRVLVNISRLYGVSKGPMSLKRGDDQAKVSVVPDAWVSLCDGKIEDYGEMSHFPEEQFGHYEKIDCTNRIVLPGFCDSHTHTVFAAWRNEEFVMKLKGLSYEEIARRGGGILNSARRLQQADEDFLYDFACQNLYAMARHGTTSFEIKTGYGLTPEAEWKMLRVINRLKENTPFLIKSTLLAAHAIPEVFKADPDGYVDQIIHQILPVAVKEYNVDFIDVFCERGFFNLSQTERILEAGIAWGVRPKVHVNQFHSSGGVALAVQYKALSVDHLEVMQPDDFEALAASNTIATVLPACSYYLHLPHAPSRTLIEKNIPLAVASDFNPGSAPSGNMWLLFGMACIQYKLLPEEVLNAITINGAYAMDIAEEAGSITPGKRADLIITEKISDISEVPYRFGQSMIHRVMAKGEFLF